MAVRGDRNRSDDDGEINLSVEEKRRKMINELHAKERARDDREKARQAEDLINQKLKLEIEEIRKKYSTAKPQDQQSATSEYGQKISHEESQFMFDTYEKMVLGKMVAYGQKLSNAESQFLFDTREKMVLGRMVAYGQKKQMAEQALRSTKCYLRVSWVGKLFTKENLKAVFSFYGGIDAVVMVNGMPQSIVVMTTEKEAFTAVERLAKINKELKIVQETEISAVTTLVTQAFESESGGELESADSKATFLQNLCDRLQVDPEKASVIHEEIYRQKLQQLVTDGELSDEDAAALLYVRAMLCIPQKTVEAAHADVCGRIFEKIVNDAIALGVDGYGVDVKAAVRKASHGLRLTRELAISIASKAVRKVFITYISQARAAANRTESATVLKQMIAFNTLVVTELVADIKGESTDSAKDETVEEEQTLPKEDEEEEEEEEWESLQTLRKTRPGSELDGKIGKPGQTEITLKDDLQVNERKELYKTYLLYSLTGDVVKIPFGAQIATRKDDREYLFLYQLGGILGLTRPETVEVHRGLAEEAFRKQDEVIPADGQLTKEVGLPDVLVEAVVLLRQGRHSEVVSTLNNLLACDKAVPATPLTWDVLEELADLFAIYLATEPSPEKTTRLQYLLGVSDSAAEVLKKRGFKLQDESKDEDSEF